MCRVFAFALLVGFSTNFTAVAYGAKVKVWHHATPAHHEKARLRSIVLNNEGALCLARKVESLADLKVGHIWAMVEDKNGDLLVATGDDGAILKVSANGKVSVAFQTDDAQVLCLTQTSDGTVYAGTGPKGQIYRINPQGEGALHFQCPDSYVWSLAADPKTDVVYAGTGPKGRIYQLEPEDLAKLFCTMKQDHVLSLAFDADGHLFAGTDKDGLVYRFEANGKGFVVYNAPQSEVRCLAATPNGIYAGTSAPLRRDIGSRSVTEKLAASGVSAVLASKNRSSTRASTGGADGSDSGESSSSPKEEKKKTNPASAAPAPAQGENSVYRIAADGTAREVFREKAMILCMLRHGTRLFAGTGMNGLLFEIDEKTGTHTEIVRIDHGQIHCLCRRRDGSIVIGTGDPGQLYVLRDAYAPSGTIESAVLDAKLPSKWGSLRWQADVPKGSRVTLAVRSGNLPEPDDTWSEWSAEQTDPETALAAAPPARYLQYRVSLATDDPHATPMVRTVSVRYCNANLAPEVESIEVPNLDAGNLEQPKKLRLKWTATDANEDELTYRVEVRKDGWQGWVALEENWEKREYEWDTTTFPPGLYQVRIIASDRKDNSAEAALTGERVSPAFPVAHVPPTVTVKLAGIDTRKAMIEATASDPMVRLTSASFSVDGKAWVNVFPTDGLFDRKTARFRFAAEGMLPGTHVLVLKVRDAAGNTGSSDVTFTIPN